MMTANANCEENSVQDTPSIDNVLQEPRLNPGVWTRTVRDLLAINYLLSILSFSPKQSPCVGSPFLDRELLKRLIGNTQGTGKAAFSTQAAYMLSPRC